MTPPTGRQMRAIAAFGAASPGVDAKYLAVGRSLGHETAERDMTLVWGGADVSLMGEFALGALLNGGKAYGVTITQLIGRETGFAHLNTEQRRALGNRVIFPDMDEETRSRLRMDIVDTMHERKRRMGEFADGFVVCTGGYGTLEEAFEILALNQQGALSKPLAFLDVAGLYNGLFAFLDGLLARGILRPEERGLALRARTPDAAFNAMEKWIVREQSRTRRGRLRGVPGAAPGTLASALAADREIHNPDAPDMVKVEPPLKPGICVAASHRCAADEVLVRAAREMGVLVAQSGKRLICGGAPTGLQGEMARACIEAGGEVVGVTTRYLYVRDGWVKGLSETYVVETMRQRKFVMQQLSDACAVLPGGFETLEQAMEYICWKQIGVQDKPLVFVNVDGIYTPLLGFFDTLAHEGFIRDADPAAGKLLPDRALALDALTPRDAMTALGFMPPQVIRTTGRVAQRNQTAEPVPRSASAPTTPGREL